MFKSFKNILKGIGSVGILPGIGSINNVAKIASGLANRQKPKTPAPAPAKTFTNVVKTPTVKSPTVARPSTGSFTYRPTSSGGGLNSLASAIASGVRVPTKTYSLKDVFSNEEQNLARQNIAARVARLINPELERGNESINTDFSSRGLFRSGLRDRGLSDFGADIEEKRQTQQEELYNIRLAEAYDALQRKQREAEREAEMLNKKINFSQYI